jgi:hypothetical protein
MTDVSSLFVDKFTLVYRCSEEDSEGIAATIRSYQDEPELSLRYLGSNYQNRRYRKNWELHIPGHGNSARVLLMADPRYSEAAPFSIEWNPRYLQRDGHQQLWEILRLFLLDNFDEFMRSAVVTRIDFAVDVTPMTPDAIWVDANHLVNCDIRTGRAGTIVEAGYAPIETISLGSGRGGATFFRIYSINAARPANALPMPEQTRIEVQLKPRVSLNEMHVDPVANPFERLLVARSVDPLTLHDAPDRYRIFLDCVQRRGLQSALCMLQYGQTRGVYRKWVSDHLQVDWFDADQIWEGYNEAWAILGLGEFLGPQRWRFSQGHRIRIRRRRGGVAAH